MSIVSGILNFVPVVKFAVRHRFWRKSNKENGSLDPLTSDLRFSQANLGYIALLPDWPFLSYEEFLIEIRRNNRFKVVYTLQSFSLDYVVGQSFNSWTESSSKRLLENSFFIMFLNFKNLIFLIKI